MDFFLLNRPCCCGNLYLTKLVCRLKCRCFGGCQGYNTDLNSFTVITSRNEVEQKFAMQNVVVCCIYEGDTVFLGRLFDKVLSSDVVEALEVNNVF